MLWLIKGNSESHSIIACNIHVDTAHDPMKKDVYQLWVTRANGKTMLIKEDTDEKEIQLVKDAIDHAIQTGDPVLRLE